MSIEWTEALHAADFAVEETVWRGMRIELRTYREGYAGWSVLFQLAGESCATAGANDSADVAREQAIAAAGRIADALAVEAAA